MLHITLLDEDDSDGVMLMPSSVCSRSDDEMVPHARFEFLECSDAFRGVREQEPLVTGVAL